MAFAAVERLIAFRYLRARREEGFISVIAGFSLVGIALGVGTLIVVMSVMNGFRIEMLRQMSAISGQLGVQGNRDGLDATPDLLARLRAVPGVVTATPSAEGQVIAIAGDHVRGVLLRGMTPSGVEMETGETSCRRSPTFNPRRSASRRPITTEKSLPKPLRLPQSMGLSSSPRHRAR